MPTNTFNPFRGHKYSLTRLRQKMGLDGPIYDSLRRFATTDVVHFKDDFVDDTLNTFWTAVATGGGAGAAAFAVNVQANGVIRGTTGTANGDTTTQSLVGPACWYGDNNAEISIRFKPITAVTETRIEMGFVDVIPGSNKSVTLVLATPTVNTSVVDAAYYCYDHTGSTTTNQLVTIGTTITAAKTTFTPPTAIAAATYYTVRLKLVGNQVTLWMDGVQVAQHAAAATDYVEGGSALAPFVLIRASNATSKSLDVDYVEITADRV